jgi:hypothetical protein
MFVGCIDKVQDGAPMRIDEDKLKCNMNESKKRWNWKDIMTMIYSIKNEHHFTKYDDHFTNSQL